MDTELPDLPDWTLHYTEVSNGIYRITATHTSGSTVVAMATGDDYDAIKQRVMDDARHMFD